MNHTELTALLSALPRLKVGVLGDFALDFYFDVQRETGEISIETGKIVHHGSGIRSSPGAAGTIVNNLGALGIDQVFAFGLVGEDLFGRELRYLLENLGVDTAGLVVSGEPSWTTYVYSKPLEAGQEASRIDFGSGNRTTPADFAQVCDRLAQHLPQLDVLIINQQFEEGLVAGGRLGAIGRLLKGKPAGLVISDLRTEAKNASFGIVKGNAREIARMFDIPAPPGENDRQCLDLARQAHMRLGRPVLMTRGAKGLLYIDKTGSIESPAIPLHGELDITGAGDACLSAFAAGLGSGATLEQALAFANLAAAVTVTKLNQTGTASPEEILALAKHYSPLQTKTT